MDIVDPSCNTNPSAMKILSLEGDSLLVFLVHLKYGLTRGLAFGGSNLIRGGLLYINYGSKIMNMFRWIF